MKDLYLRLGIATNETDLNVIRSAARKLAASDPQLAKRAEVFLSDSGLRETYDARRDVSVNIGQIRSNLGWTNYENWKSTRSDDFNVASVSWGPSLAQLRVQSSSDPFAIDPKERKLAFIGVGIGILVIIGGAVLWLSSLQTTRPRANAASVPLPSPVQVVEGTTLPPPAAPVVQTPAEDRFARLARTLLGRDGSVPSSETVDVAASLMRSGTALPRPSTGVLWRSGSDAVAPLEVRTTIGKDYYIKVVDWTTKREVMTAYIRGGEPFETQMPLGTFEIRYAAGTQWFGTDLDFGPTASYSRADDSFMFTRDAQGVSGYTLELILQRNGNLQTDPIDPSAF